MGKTTSRGSFYPGDHGQLSGTPWRALGLLCNPGLPFPPMGSSTKVGPCPPSQENHRPHPQALWLLNQVLCFKQCPHPVPHLPLGSPSVGTRRLLGIFEDAAMAEVIDMAAKEHQLGVRVLGHCAMRWGRVVCRGGYQCCLPAGEALASALGHGTEPAGTNAGSAHRSHTCKKSDSFPTLAGRARMAPPCPQGPHLICGKPALLCHWGATPARASSPRFPPSAVLSPPTLL